LGKGTVSSEKDLHGGIPVQSALHRPGISGLLLFDKKVEGNEVAVAHEYKGNGACLLMDIRWSGVLFVVLGFPTRGSRLTNVQRTAILLFTFWDARDVLGSIFMVANTSDGCR
jgi:hypothetical protein